jgi:RNA polymerase sigma-70 factor, ECF subfamily
MPMRHPSHVSREEGRVPSKGSESFEAFFDEQHADLFGALYLITRNRHEADEIMQDAFLNLWERWEKVSSLADPVGYLYRTALNLFRKRWRRASLSLKRSAGLAPRDDEIALIEMRVDVIRAMGPLSPRQRAAIVLTDLLGYSSEEAGSMMGIAPATVRMHASRGRAALASTLEDHR